MLLTCLALQVAAVTHAPMTSDVGPRGLRVWCRAAAPGEFELLASDSSGAHVARATSQADPEGDLCLHWKLDGLEPAREYSLTIRGPGSAVGPRWTIRTTPDSPTNATLAFGSCANDKTFVRQPVWDLIRKSGADALFLLGDAPYIDDSSLDVKRARFRAFFDHPDVRETMVRIPFHCTWDDHDFGTNDCDGRVAGHEVARRAFVEYHPNPEVGEDGRGIYSAYRRGPIEVFLLDTRTFSRTEDSAFADGRPSLLGARQWAWLESRLLASTAPFKVLACGMIWNDAVRPAKSDYWGAYPWEREHLFRFLGEHAVPGIVLVGGDIHRSRVVRHPTRERVGYEITELITSPMAQSVIASADAPTAGLVWDAGVGQSCMILDADATTLTARFLQAVNPADPSEIFTTRVFAEHLRRGPAMNWNDGSRGGFLFRELTAESRSYRYAVYVPRDWDRARGGPGLVFLHGSGECGTDGTRQLAQGLAPAIEAQNANWPFVVVFPQKPSALEEWEEHSPAVLAMLDRAIEEFAVDRRRVGLTGLSQGGHGTWEIASRHPDRFAAIVPICGYAAAPAEGWAAFDARRDWADERQRAAGARFAAALGAMPVWVFHGARDEVVPARISDVVVEEFRKLGHSPRSVTLAGVGHDAWTPAYRDPGLVTWWRERLH